MRTACHLSVLLLAVIGFGCQRNGALGTAKDATEVKPPAEKQRYAETRWDTERDVADLCGIIEGLFAELGITVTREEETPARCRYGGKSPSGEDVIVEATAIVRGHSFVEVRVSNTTVGQLVLGRVSQGLVEATSANGPPAHGRGPVVRRQRAAADWEAPLDVAVVCQIIEQELGELDIAIEQKDQKGGHCRFECKSPSGEDVTVQATAVVKARSLVQVEASRTSIGNMIREAVSEAIRGEVGKRIGHP